MDADFSHDPDDIPRLQEAAQNADCALGSRYLNGIRIINWPLNRLMLSKVVQPGGSKRDAEVIAAADEHGIAMVFTGMRHFRH